MKKSELEASVHRFHDKVGALLGNGDTVYLSPDEAIQIANQLMTCALDIKEKDFLSSQFKTSAIAIKYNAGGGSGSYCATKNDVVRQKPVYLYAVTGRVTGEDSDATLIVSAADDDAACSAFADEITADLDDDRVGFLMEQYGTTVYNIELQRIGAIAGSFVLVEDAELLPKLTVSGAFDEEDFITVHGIDIDAVSEWAGLHYKFNFDSAGADKRQEFLERYVEMHPARPVMGG